MNAPAPGGDHERDRRVRGVYFLTKYTERGKIEDILVDPSDLDERYQFGIRASADTWRKFSQPTPPPMYHGIWAASFQRDMRLEGDLLILMQNLRCLTRQLELLRATGSPV